MMKHLDSLEWFCVGQLGLLIEDTLPRCLRVELDNPSRKLLMEKVKAQSVGRRNILFQMVLEMIPSQSDHINGENLTIREVHENSVDTRFTELERELFYDCLGDFKIIHLWKIAVIMRQFATGRSRGGN